MELWVLLDNCAGKDWDLHMKHAGAHASIEIAAHFHAQFEDCRDKDEIVPREMSLGSLYQRKEKATITELNIAMI